MAGLLLTVMVVFSSPARAAKFTNTDWHVKPGEMFTITWEALGLWANISLMEGEPASMTELTLVTRQTASKFDWEVPDWLDTRYMLPNNTNSYLYALRISDSREVTNWSPPLQLKVETNTNTISNITAPEDPITASPTDLSTAAKAGIGVSAGVVAITILALVGYYFYNRGKKVEASRNGWTKYSTGSSGDLESGSGSGSPVSPISPTTLEELHADKIPTPELEVVESPVELGGPTCWELSTGEKCLEEMAMESVREGDQSPEGEGGNNIQDTTSNSASVKEKDEKGNLET